MDKGRNRPATHAEVRALGERDEKGDIAPRAYVHSGPNRRTRRAWERAGSQNFQHNNRKQTKARKTQRVELERAVITKDQKVITVKTGVFRSMRLIRTWLTGGFRTNRH